MIDTRRKERKAFFLLLFGVLLITFASGCGGGGGIKHHARPGIDPGAINRIAVLPFENFTQDKFADEKIKRLVVIDLLERGIDVIEPGEVMVLLREMKVRSLRSITSRDIIQIGKVLKVQAVMVGSVGVFKVSRGISVSYPEVSMSLMMHEASTGDIMWSAWHTTGGAGFWTRHFGAEGATLDETAKELINDTIDTIYKK